MSKDGRGFFLLSAINGLIERARSSAEKESQRLFTTPEHGASAAAAAAAAPRPPPAPPLPPPPRFAPQREAGRSRQNAPPSTTRHRPRPPRRQESTTTTTTAATHERRQESTTAHENRRESAAHERGGLPLPRAPSVMSERAQLAATVDMLALGAAGPRRGSVADSAASKRKWEDHHRSGTPPESPLAHRQPQQQQQQHVLQRQRAESGASAKKARLADAEPGRPHAGSARSSMTAVSAALETQQRARLEKVERELHRLKKIIASLLPEELNDDDLRSVYGDPVRPRLVSDDAIARMIKARFGAQLPLSPLSDPPVSGASADPLTGGTGSSGPAIPVPPPLPPINSAFPAPAARARGSASLSSSSLVGEQPPRVPPAAVQRLRAELRPVSNRAARAPGAAHRDPGVMAELLAEMKHHKLRPVKKPRDMCAS
ncbi:hypothetical protein H4R18_003610 [Coemansia javaensis]|uniref:Uncharacterized protein n=1 Tax=Coemansia javaensis TaxID=2761396 RepID=A0A9W8HD80_9FUNG|nr:hypothetical protein H4R18_003610 [Coemansia javaensis]